MSIGFRWQEIRAGQRYRYISLRTLFNTMTASLVLCACKPDWKIMPKPVGYIIWTTRFVSTQQSQLTFHLIRLYDKLFNRYILYSRQGNGSRGTRLAETLWKNELISAASCCILPSGDKQFNGCCRDWPVMRLTALHHCLGPAFRRLLTQRL